MKAALQAPGSQKGCLSASQQQHFRYLRQSGHCGLHPIPDRRNSWGCGSQVQSAETKAKTTGKSRLKSRPQVGK